jgi:shikimate dehydrogenase
MRTIALIGDPVVQSPSPQMHRAAFASAGVDLDYVAERVTAAELPVLFEDIRAKHIGLNVTRPLKELIVPLLDEVRGEAATTGSVNTVTFADGRAVGESTDGPGFMSALRRSGAPEPQRALLLGSGGSARAVGAALRSAGAEVTIAARNAERGSAVAELLGARAIPLDAAPVAEALDAADLLVNTTPLGQTSPLPEDVRLRPGLTVFDIVYAPEQTALLARALDAGCRTVGGLMMLIEQAALSFEIWTGVTAPRETMRRAAFEAFDRRAGV